MESADHKRAADSEEQPEKHNVTIDEGRADWIFGQKMCDLVKFVTSRPL